MPFAYSCGDISAALRKSRLLTSRGGPGSPGRAPWLATASRAARSSAPSSPTPASLEDFATLARADGQGNLIFSGLNWKWYAVFFLPVLALALPRLAQVEEISYRTGTRNWLDGSLRSLRFGLAHLLMLIPFGASLALSLGGLWFTRQYFKGGTERSTIYHAAMNTVIVAVLFIAILVTW